MGEHLDPEPAARTSTTIVRGLQPEIIINNRVGPAARAWKGLTDGQGFAATSARPNSRSRPPAFPGVDWETCMTMNDHWGYNKHDQNWKSTTRPDPQAGRHRLQGRQLPAERRPDRRRAVSRRRASSAWRRSAGGWRSTASRSTAPRPARSSRWPGAGDAEGGRRRHPLYLHVFDWPTDGALLVPGLLATRCAAYLLADAAGTELCRGPGPGSTWSVSLPPTGFTTTASWCSSLRVRPMSTIRRRFAPKPASSSTSLDVTIASDRRGGGSPLYDGRDGSRASSPLVSESPPPDSSAVVAARGFPGRQARKRPRPGGIQEGRPPTGGQGCGYESRPQGRLLRRGLG